MSEKKIGLFSLTCIGLTGIIGSGWLFASMYAAQATGTGSLLAWLIGAALMFLLALCYAELAVLYPKRGLLASISTYSHNKDFAFIISIANWFGSLCVIPSEALATVRYLEWPHWTTFILIVIYAVLNYWGVKIFARFNNVITIFKFIVPTLVAIALLSHGINTDNFHAHELTNMSAIMTTVITGGVFYALGGSQNISNFTTEANNPQRNIPLAIFCCLAISLVLYMLLQTAYIGTVPNLSVDYNNPFVQLILSIGLGWLVILLQADAAISPSGTGFMYMSSSTRMLTALSREGQMPKEIAVKSDKYNMSHRSLFINVVLSILMMAAFQTWQDLVIVVSAFGTISYMSAPLSLGRLRITLPNEKRVFKTPFAWIVCPFLFFLLSYLFTKAGYDVDSKVTMICIAFLAIYIVINYRGQHAIIAISRSAYIPIWLIIFSLCAKLQLNVWYILVFSIILYYAGIGIENVKENNK